jgi:serine/threonine protein kinase
MISNRPPRSHQARQNARSGFAPTGPLVHVTLCHARVVAAALKLRAAVAANPNGVADAPLADAQHGLQTALRRLLAAVTAVPRTTGTEAQHALALHALLGDVLQPPAKGGKLSLALQHGQPILSHVRAAVEELSATAVSALWAEVLRPDATLDELGTVADQLERLSAYPVGAKAQIMLTAVRTQVREVQDWLRLIGNDGGPSNVLAGAPWPQSTGPHAPSAQMLARPAAAGAARAPGLKVATTLRPPAAVWHQEAAATSSLSPVTPGAQLLQSIKVKWPRQVYAHTSFGDRIFSKLYDAQSKYYVMTDTMAQGGSGKVRYAVDSYGNIVAIKEIDHTHRPPYNAAGKRLTYQVDRADALNEFEKTKQLRAIIDDGLLQLSRSGSVNQRSLGIVRTGIEPFVGIAAIQVDGEQGGVYKSRTYLVMSKETGDLVSLHWHLTTHPSVTASKQACAVLGLSVATQGFSELAILHDGGKHAHLDLKPDNLFFSQNGQIKIMDYGWAAPLNDLGLTSHQGAAGSIATPEAAIALNVGTFYLSQAADVFALAVVIFELATPVKDYANPFYSNQRVEGIPADSDAVYFALLFEQFEQWKRERTDPATHRVTARAIVDQQGGSFLDGLFLGLATVSPPLCELLINDAMCNDPTLRLNADELGRKSRDLLPTMHGQMQELRQHMQSYHDTLGLDELRLKARAYDAWEKQYAASVAQQGHKWGQVRPLPG